MERTFAWLGRWRWLTRDYEYLPETSETLIRIAMIGLMLKRLAPAKDFFDTLLIAGDRNGPSLRASNAKRQCVSQRVQVEAGDAHQD